ncbi:MAG: AraC family transcriptional regulator [Gammaproteobacteria bacterium]|nr:AraC family transcriptional regulator [Gammaproteobacteria bacterium]
MQRGHESQAAAKQVQDYYAADSVQPFLPGQGVRLVPEIAGAYGYRDVIHIEDGFDMVVGDVRHEQSASIRIAEGAVLKFHFRLSGRGSAALDDGNRVDISERCCMLLLHADGIAKREWFFAGQHEQSVTLLCGSGFLKSRFADLIVDLPPYMREFVDGQTRQSQQRTMPFRADMARIAASLLACELSGSLRNVFAQGKAYELLAFGMQSAIDAEDGCERRDLGLTGSDLDTLHAARKKLEREFLMPPRIADLARHAGLAETKLMRGFKQVFGITIFDFVQQQRMELAKKLIETTDLSVTEVALEVGYEYPGNFTTAFRRYFGITPKAARHAANP